MSNTKVFKGNLLKLKALVLEHHSLAQRSTVNLPSSEKQDRSVSKTTKDMEEILNQIIEAIKSSLKIFENENYRAPPT